MKLRLLLLFVYPLFCSAQYCIPTQETAAIAPVINRVAIGIIDNANSGFALTDVGYSDYTNLSTTLNLGETQTISITTADDFSHNFGVWIDYDRNGIFTDEEVIDIFELGFPNPLSKEITFELPSFATNGTTRLRVRGMLEPFGPWSLSMHPCLPSEFDGETEDYTIEITGGINGSVALSEWIEPTSKVGLGTENISVAIKNTGSITAENITANFSVNNTVVFSEIIPNALAPDGSTVFTFSDTYDFSDITCEDISVDLEWTGDQNSSDNSILKNVCRLEPINGDKVWYLHSFINGGIEPLGGDPFYSTTNEVTMNTVFGENNWQQGFFETSNMNEVFSDSTCVVFLDGSFDHTTPLENLLAVYGSQIENWVAAGGKLFINCAKETGDYFYTNVGFDDTYISFYSVAHGRLNLGHPLLEGPHQPMENDYSGFYFSNAVITGDSLSTVVFETEDEWSFNAPVLHLPILAEKSWGAGKILLGGLTPSQLVEPMASAMNLRANALEFLHDCEVIILSEKEQLASGDLNVHPNPVNELLFIEGLESYIGHKYIRIVARSGKPVLEKELTSAVYLDISDLPDGLYFIELETSDFVKVGKFVKN